MIARKVSSSLEGSKLKTKAKQHAGGQEALYICLAFFAACVVTYQSHDDLGLCTLITLTVALQFLAYLLLAVKVVKQQSVRGVSGKALQCYALVYMSRLSSTTWLKGYIPTDTTGEGLYQAMDFSSLLTVLFLLYQVHYRLRDTYQEDEDTFDIGYLLCGCLILAVLVHPDLNSKPLFDTAWALALYIDVFAMMPQLWMVAKLEAGAEGKPKLEGFSVHYIAAITASRGLNLYFWFHAYSEFAPTDGGFNINGWTIMIAIIVQNLLLLDFAFLYVKACVLGSVRALNDKGGSSFFQPGMDRGCDRCVLYDL